ncbi:SDR family NAD(P)-dependent oxidoreductase, partial [Acinetobacter baumannii]
MLALVTGASAGFGYSISKKLIESGYKVIGCGRRAEKLEELQKQLGENFYPLVFDMTDTAENINKGAVVDKVKYPSNPTVFRAVVLDSH